MLKKILISVLTCATLSHASNFNVDVENQTDPGSFSQGYSNITDAIDGLKINSIKQRINYDDTHAIKSRMDFRGLPISFDYALNSTRLTLSIPSIGVTQTFDGATRDDSMDGFTDWLKKDGGATVEKMMKELAKVSPVDPIAGNPNSMMSLNVSNDFSNGFINVATKQNISNISNISGSSSSNNIIIVPTYSSLDVDSKKSDSYSLPLSYFFNFDSDFRENITMSLPITYIEVEGAKSASLGFGLSYTKPIMKNWLLTPAIGYGVAGSADLASFAQVASASLTSSYSLDLPSDFVLSMGNMVGYYTTVKFISHDYAYNPGIENIVYRNALMLNMPTDSLINNTSLEIFVIDTRYTGTALYMEQYQEYGLSYGYDSVNVNMASDEEKYSIRKSLKIGFSYLDATKGNGFKVNFGFVF